MGATLTIVNLCGFVGTMIALYTRVGFPDVEPDWREFLFANLWWFGLMLAKALLWPITFGVWLYQGRPPSTWRAVTQIDGRPVRRIVRTGTAAGS